MDGKYASSTRVTPDACGMLIVGWDSAVLIPDTKRYNLYSSHADRASPAYSVPGIARKEAAPLAGSQLSRWSMALCPGRTRQ